jgi:hypothetical protein
MGRRMEEVMRNNFPDIPHDVVFVVGEEKERISSHKFPLAVASPLFQVMFSGRHNPQQITTGMEICHVSKTPTTSPASDSSKLCRKVRK